MDACVPGYPRNRPSDLAVPAVSRGGYWLWHDQTAGRCSPVPVTTLVFDRATPCGTASSAPRGQ